jgi:long-chain acyl-CoA synthetase
MSRNGSLRGALRQAGELIDSGKTLLIFPEGTRGNGEISEFKAAVGHLALHHKVDILPVYLGGTHRALPKGATLLRSRNVEARIGKPLAYDDVRRLTAGLSASDAARAVSRLVHKAVLALSRGEVFTLDDLDPEDVAPSVRSEPQGLEPVFRELEHRFVAGAVQQPVSYYFSLGATERWTVRITPESCEVAQGKVVSPADCVLKTSPDMFTRIVREAYTPSAQEFMSGTVKSNNIQLLLTFQKAFQLSEPS